MAAPTYDAANVNSGTTDAGGAWTKTFTAVTNDVGKFIIFHLLQDGATAGAVAVTSVAGIENLAGTDNAVTAVAVDQPVGSATAALQSLYCGRVIAGATPAISGTNSTSEDLYIRGYAFDDVNAGTTLADVIENGTAGVAVNGAGTSDTIADTAVETLGVDRLVCNFVGINDDNAVDAFTGMTGGTWAEAESEYAEASGTDGCIQLQTATLATAGTINGGAYTMAASDAWGVVGFALIGTTPDVVEYVPRNPAINHQNPALLARLHDRYRRTRAGLWLPERPGLVVPRAA